jgi:anti-sigma B factor antagonist
VKARFEERGEVGILAVAGAVDAGPHADAFRQVVADLIDRGHARLVLDLESVHFLDSAGLGEIVAARRRCRERGGSLVLARPRGKPRDLLALTRVDELVPVLDDLDAAVARASGDGNR